MLADGTDVQKITDDSLAAGVPRWSPNGSQIMFAENFCSLNESDIFMVNPDGSGVTQITDTPENEIGGGWSPDGTQVVANLSRLVPGDLHKGDIAIVDVATGAVTNLTQSNGVSEDHPTGRL